MSQMNNDITSQVGSSPDFDNHLNNLIQCISDNDCDECESITSSQHFTNNEPHKNCNTLCQLSPISGIRSSSLNDDKYLQPLQNTAESNKVRQSANIRDDKVMVTEFVLIHGSKTTNVLSKMSADFSKQGPNNSDEESIYKVVPHVTEIRKNLKRKNSNYSGSVEQGQNCHPSSSWPCDTSKLRKIKYQSDSNLTNIENGYNTDSELLQDKTCRAPTEELILGETYKTCRAATKELLFGETDKTFRAPAEALHFGETDKTSNSPTEELLFGETDKTSNSPTEELLFGETDKKCRAPTEELILGEKDKTFRAPHEELLFGETDKTSNSPTEELLFGETDKTSNSPTEELLFGVTDKICRAPTEELILGETDKTSNSPTEELLFGETDKICRAPTEELILGEKDKTYRAPAEELLIGETDKPCKALTRELLIGKTDKTCTSPTEELFFGETDKTHRAPTEELILGEKDKTYRAPAEELLFGETDKTSNSPTEELLFGEINKTSNSPTEELLFGETDKTSNSPTEELLFGEINKTSNSPTEELLFGETDKTSNSPTEELLFGETDITSNSPTEELLFGEKDKTCRAPTEELILGEKDKTCTSPTEDLLFGEMYETRRVPAEELLLGETDKTCRAPTEEQHLEETESFHYKKALGQEMFNESFETEINRKSLTNMPQFTQGVNQHQKSVFEVHVISQCVSDEPVLDQDRAKNMRSHAIDESSVLLKMPVVDLNYAAYSQPDMSPLYFTGESLPFLVQQTLSPSALLPKDLSNQPKVSSQTSTSVRSNDFLMASTHSPHLSHAAPCLKEEPRSVELFSSPSSVESSSCGPSNISQHKNHLSQSDKHSIVCLSEELPHNYINGNLPETSCKDLNCNPVTKAPHINLGELTQADIIVPLPAVSTAITPLQCEFTNRSEHLRQDVLFAVKPPIDSTVNITHKLPSRFTIESPVKIYERSITPVYEMPTRNISLEYVTALNSNELELCQHQHQKHAMSNDCEYEYQELPRSPPMLMNLDGIPYSLPSDDYFVPQDEEVKENKGKCIIRELESNTTISDNDHNYCEETKQGLLSEAEILHSADINIGSVHENEDNLSWPKIISTGTKHNHASTRVSLSLSANLDDNNGSITISSTEEGNPPQHCPGKHVLSHLGNETSILSFEDTVNSDDHIVPDAEPCEKMCLSEISLYSDLPENRQDDLKCKQKTKQAFEWKTVYETQMNKSLTEQISGDSVFEGLSSIQPICQSHRPRHVGLSRKQKVKHLHNKP